MSGIIYILCQKLLRVNTLELVTMCHRWYFCSHVERTKKCQNFEMENQFVQPLQIITCIVWEQKARRPSRPISDTSYSFENHIKNS